MRFFLYIVWFLPALLFILLTLWGALEQLGRSKKRSAVENSLQQAVFLLAAAFLSLLIDRFILIPHIEGTLPHWLPFGILEVALFPLVLLILSVAIGPSKDIRIVRRSGRSEEGR